MLCALAKPVALFAQIPSDLLVSPVKPDPMVPKERSFALSTLSNGTVQQVFAAPPCWTGQYYVAFQLYYDLGDAQTQNNWTADLSLTFLNNTTTLWSKSVGVKMTDQTFVATVFHDTPISCDVNYKIRVDTKTLTGTVPQSNIYLRVLFYRYRENNFVPTATAALNCTNANGEKSVVSWSYSGDVDLPLAYDLEWVFIANTDNYTGTTQNAFVFREPVRITTAASNYSHATYYLDGRLWYRVRAIGYNPAFPEHRIPGAWSYFGPLTIANHEKTLTWQQQTIYAEEGKYKEVMTYFDATLRQRQQLINLSTSQDTAMVGETYYDYEGREAISVMAVPAASQSLGYKNENPFSPFNAFVSQNSTVTANTTAMKRVKFHYDNDVLTNSIVGTTGGAGKYYSPSVSTYSGFRRAYIPDAEGYVYSQNEYLNDGTGRLKRQAGVGKEFRMDGTGRPTQYFYGNATPQELIRLFGTNVGNATHYSKNMVVDPNGQVSVSYQDQEDRVVATALAGDPPASVTPLSSYTELSATPLLVDLSPKNTIFEGKSVINQKILNAVPNTIYTFNYNLASLASSLANIGCVNCVYDVKITITDPDGALINLNSPTSIPGNQSADGYSYEQKGITITSCSNLTTGANVQFPVTFTRMGDYTVSKTVTPTDLTYVQAKNLLKSASSIQAKIQIIQNNYTVDAANCDICTSCPEADAEISKAIGEIADQDCSNMYRLIVQALKDLHPNEPEYVPTDTEITGHQDYCQYQLCLSTKTSAVFEKQMAMVKDWSGSTLYQNLANLSFSPYPDPFFQSGGLGYGSSMQTKLNNVFVATVAYDNNADGVSDGTQNFSGTILQVIDPLNTAYYIDQNGNATTSTATGNHILYYDLMSRRKAGQITQAFYDSELLKWRWSFFKSYYQEAKRLVKLELSQYQTCPAALQRLNSTGGALPKTEDDIKNFGDASWVTVPISTREIQSLYYSIKYTCSNLKIATADSLTITSRLKSYFDEKPNGLFHFILPGDVGVNPHLIAVQAVLGSYGCASLSTFAEVDPITCTQTKTVTLKNIFVPQAGGVGQSLMAQQSASTTKLAAIQADQTSSLQVESQQQSLAQTSPQGTSGMVVALSAPLPSAAEYNALMAIYTSTVGTGWTNKAGWSTANPSVVQDVSGFYGVTVDGVTGHVTGLNLAMNNLTGTLSTQVGNLTFLTNLQLYNNQIGGTIPTTIGSLTSLTILYLNDNKFTGTVPTQLGSLTNLTDLWFRNNLLTGTLPTQLGSLVNLKVFRIGGTSLATANQFSGGIPSTFSGLINLETFDVAYSPIGGNFPTWLPSLTKLKELYLNNCRLGGTLPDNVNYPPNLSYFLVQENGPLQSGSLGGAIPVSISKLKSLNTLNLSKCAFTGSIPSQLGGLTGTVTLWLDNNQLTGAIPNMFGNMPNLAQFSVNNNQLSGSLPETLSQLANLRELWAGSNLLTGVVPNSLKKLTKLQYVQLENNSLQGDLSYPLLGSKTSLIQIYAAFNKFTFKDLILLKQQFSGSFAYSPQDSVDLRKTLTVPIGSSRTLTANIDRTTTPASVYQWFRYVNGTSDVALNTASTTGYSYTLTNVSSADAGKRFYYKITNTAVPGLTLTSRMQVLNPAPNGDRIINICLKSDSLNATLQKFTYLPNWNLVVQKCMASAQAERDTLLSYAVNKMLDTEISTFYTQQTTNCLDKSRLKEVFSYAYRSKEYHYTLYYYDQAGNLEQTVPPAGVMPLDTVTVRKFLQGTKVDPQHKMITRYQYNATNNPIWQQTPDAGESRFWYNDKVQLRLSQNAQQLKDNNYAYSKYDNIGRVAEVGELNTTTPQLTLLGQLSDNTFPVASGSFVLSDVTNTYYDLPNAAIQATFPQTFLRTRVSYVEVREKGTSDVIATYYSYDIHGTVKSLLQQIPQLPNKRTDYVYDLIGGNVNYAIYQYGASDQFIHRYSYDTDKRLKRVETSTDGYVFDIDATYKYYQHGPLARVELGHYRVQGLDYYYTLQGNMKGVNMPFAADQGLDGYSGINLRVGRDVFSYALGYYENDYKPSGANIIADVRDQLWTRYKSVMGASNSGMYNGNISWMIADLKKIGQVKGARAKGMQAMLYKYDQLDRVVQSRSLATYAAATGFASRTGSPAVYDEDFTFDANGNIKTVQRRDNAAALADDFAYSYYKDNNRLRYYKPLLTDTTYSGAIATNNKTYQTILVKATAYAPANTNPVIKAVDRINFEPGFDIQTNATFRAYVLGDDEGAFNYDANGNMIWDQEKGVQVSWTPYGKVRSTSKSNGTVVTYRYDAAGNRIERKMVKADASVIITRYIHGAHGKVMAIYNNTILSEQPIYGIERLGEYVSGRIAGQRKLGLKTFELANHLGNVLTTITDNIRMTPDSTWATVVSANDYYAFGASLPGRTFADNSYRYGFNGKEKDMNGEFGDLQYDYGFRIYNPRLGRFLSVDPLTKSYAALTPYQFASNKPINGIDLDGLEFYQDGILDIKLLGYKAEGNYVINDFAISRDLFRAVQSANNPPPEQFDDNYERTDFVGFSKSKPNSNTHYTGEYSQEDEQVYIYSKTVGGTRLDAILDLINNLRFFIPANQARLRLGTQGVALDRGEELIKKVEKQLPDILNNDLIKADLINYMADFTTLPSSKESGVNDEYIHMIKVIAVDLYEHRIKILKNDYTLLNTLEVHQFPSGKAIERKPRLHITNAIDAYKSSGAAKRGAPILKACDKCRR